MLDRKCSLTRIDDVKKDSLGCCRGDGDEMMRGEARPVGGVGVVVYVVVSCVWCLGVLKCLVSCLFVN